MRTCNDYKDHVKAIDGEGRKDIEKIENLAEIIGTIVRKRNELGISQRTLSAMCDMPQSTVVRIESFITIPNLDTLLKIMQPLGLTFTVSEIKK